MPPSFFDLKSYFSFDRDDQSVSQSFLCGLFAISGASSARRYKKCECPPSVVATLASSCRLDVHASVVSSDAA